MSCGSTSVFGNKSQYIKTNGGDLISIDGSNIGEKLILSDLRIPYKQILKSRIILKAGQVNYLLNHLGLGDNATFLCIKAVYSVKSVIEVDNYINWSYYDNLSRVNSFSTLMVLSGNSTNRVPQIYLTNPNSKYDVFIDVMVAVIDDEYSFFSDVTNQSGTSFVGLEYTDIKTYIVGESIVVNDKSSPTRPLLYLNLVDIDSIEKSGNILIIETVSDSILLMFLTENDAFQAHSLINYILENPNINIDDISPLEDTTEPIVYFNSHAGLTGSYISFNGATSGVPYDTTDGYTFSTSISLSTFGTVSGTVIDKNQLIYLLIDSIVDNRDGEIGLLGSNLVITGTSGVVSSITSTGTYSVTFDFSDIAQNYLDQYLINIDITS